MTRQPTRVAFRANFSPQPGYVMAGGSVTHDDALTDMLIRTFGAERHGLRLVGPGEDRDFLVILNYLREPPRFPRARTLGVTLEPRWSGGHFRPRWLADHCAAVLTPFPDDVPSHTRAHFGLTLLPPWTGTLDQSYAPPTRALSVVVSTMGDPGGRTLYEDRRRLVGALLASDLDVDIFGGWQGDDPRLRGWVADKGEAVAPYARTIAVENSVYPGYSTEKLIDPLLHGRQVIYCGDPMAQLVFGDAVVALDLADPIPQLRRLLATPVDVDACLRARAVYVEQTNLLAQVAHVLAQLG